jgi:hypothetical protein
MPTTARAGRLIRAQSEIAMSFKAILVPIEQHDLMNSTLETALLLARKFDSYIEGFALRAAIPAAFAVGDISAVPIPTLEREIAEGDKQSRSLFENFMHGQERRPRRLIRSPRRRGRAKWAAR